MTRVAAIDCGTNSIRLLIADRDADGTLHDVVRLMRIVRLGEGVDRTGQFQKAALHRTFEACDEYRDILRQHDAQRLRFIATSATRDASNRAVFIDGVRERLGVEPEVITGDQEADLSFTGARSALAKGVANPILVVDIGGGSTEFVLGDTHPRAAVSVDIGCVRMTERHLAADPPTPEQIAAVRADVRSALTRADASVPLTETKTLVGLAGTVTTIAALALDLPAYDPEALHGSWITTEQVHAVANQLIEMPRAERAALAVMHPGRVDVIVGGALVLDEICQVVPVPGVVVSEHDILDGIALNVD